MGRNRGALGMALAIVLGVGGVSEAGGVDAKNIAIAREAARAIFDGQYDKAVKHFDKTMSAALGADKLRETMEGLVAQAGKMLSLGEPKGERAGAHDVVLIPARFEKGAMRFRIVLSAKNEIVGLFIQPDVQAVAYEKAPYDDPSAYRETDVEFGLPGWRLKGKLTVPISRSLHPVVILVHGSGPHDADETIGPNKPFRDLAGGLASRGVAVLRYDKRTFAHGAKIASVENFGIKEEVIEDAVEAARFVRKQRGNIDPNRVYVLGHSLGASVAPLIAEADGKLSGIILAAGTGRDMYEVVQEQLDYLASLKSDQRETNRKVARETRAAIQRIRGGKAKKGETVLGVPAAYWNDVNDAIARSVKLLSTMTPRVLVIGGGRDYQVTKADFDIYSAALKGRPNATLKWYDNLNHLFMAGKKKATPAEYEKAGHVDKRVIELIAEWVQSPGGG